MLKILIIDAAENAQIAAAVLKGHYEVVTTESEKGLKAKLMAEKPDMLMITSDIEKINYKYAINDVIRREDDFAAMPVAILTAAPTQEVVATAGAAGAEVIAKPYEPLEFIRRIDKLAETMKPLKDRLDLVTKLHKREYTEQRIQELFPEKSGTLFIIDVAKFRFASQPISEEISASSAEVVEEQAKLFNAILGVQKDRKLIGYLPGINERPICMSWAKNVIKEIQEKLSGQKIYVSIGFACNDEKVENYKDLYQQCDRALNLSREKGSNMASYY